VPTRDKPISFPSLGDLIRACAEGDDARAWEEFVRRVQPVIAATVLRTARRFRATSRALIDDLVQETFVKICANRCRVLREFQAENPEAIFGLVKSVALCATHDHFRSEFAAKRGSGHGDVVLDSYSESAIAGPEGLPEMERKVLLSEIDDLLADSPRLERRIFWLYYRVGLTTRAIAALPGIGLSQKGVESLIQRLTVRVRAFLVESRVKKEN